MTTVVVVDEAQQQVREIVEWWIANRTAAPTLALDELEHCVSLLESTPDVGLRFHRTSVPGVRRVMMKRTSHHVYYVHDADHAIVYVIAVWGAPKHGDPVLRDPTG